MIITQDQDYNGVLSTFLLGEAELGHAECILAMYRSFLYITDEKDL